MGLKCIHLSSASYFFVYHLGVGGKKHQLATVKITLEFSKAMTFKFSPSSLSITPYHLNSMDQMLG